MSLFSWLLGNRRRKEITSAADKPHSTGLPPLGRFGTSRLMPEGDWVKATMVVKAAGVMHRRAEASAFACAANKAEKSGTSYGLRLVPEPSNRHDKNAIAVYGHTSGEEWHIGYLDADTAQDITEDIVAKGHPIAAEMYEIWVGDNGFIDIKLIVLAPPGNSEKSRRKRKSASAKSPVQPIEPRRS